MFSATFIVEWLVKFIICVFRRVDEFEFTPECVIFDLLSIPLYHGWLVDPQSTEYKNAIKNLSYNQLVEKIVASKESNEGSELTSEGMFDVYYICFEDVICV